MTSVLRKWATLLSLSAVSSCTTILGIEELHQGDVGSADASTEAAHTDGSTDAAGAEAGDASFDGGNADSAGSRDGGEPKSDGSDASDGPRSDDAAGDAGTSDAARDAVADAMAVVDAAVIDAGVVDATLADAVARDASDAPDAVATVDASEAGAVDAGVSDASVPSDAAAEAGPILITVQGHLIDGWRHDVPGAQIAVGAKTATTDATGHFVIADVAPPYDISALIFGSAATTVGTQGWLYRGLRRADPTLQVSVALPQHANSVLAQFSNVTSPLPDNAGIIVAFGSADGNGGIEVTSTAINYSDILWRGPAQTSGSLHALRLQRANSDSYAPPTMYQGYDVKPYALDDTAASSEVALNLATTAIPTGTVSGVVASAATGEAENDAWSVFSSGAVMKLLADRIGNGAFSYVVPSLPSSNIVFSAQRGSHYYPPFAVAHVDGLAPGAAVGTVTVPAVATPALPVSGALGVDSATTFMWTGQGPETVSIMGISFQNVDVNFFVVTTGTTATIPNIPNFSVPKNAVATWYMETHGPYATMDDAAGPTGMLDAFRQTGEYQRPPTPSRRFTQSEERGFTTAP